MRPVPADRIRTAQRLGVEHATELAVACRRARLPYSTACALTMKESGGLNVYGHDQGGVYSTPALGRPPSGLVTPANFGVFLIRITAGGTSNGVGPMQITYAADLPDGRSGGYFRVMLEQGLLPWDVTDNMTFGCDLLARNLAAHPGNLGQAGAHYNGGTHPGPTALRYGADLVARDSQFRQAFGL